MIDQAGFDLPTPLGGRNPDVLTCIANLSNDEVFTPSQQDIALAAKVIQADEQAKKEGRGAVAVEGRMVDQATVRLATQLWQQAKHLGLV